MVVLLESAPISTEELWISVRVTIGRVLVVQKFFHLRMLKATVFLGTFNAAEMFWYPSPDLCLDTIMSCFCSDMHCQLWDLI